MVEPLVLTFALVSLRIYRAYLRQVPSGFPSQQIVEAVRACSESEDFEFVCQTLCHVKPSQYRTFRDWVRQAIVHARSRLQEVEARPLHPLENPVRLEHPPLILMQLGILRGGWIGRLHHPMGTSYALAIANYPSWAGIVARAAAIHELFHMMRHIQKIATFEDELTWRFFKRFRITMREEGYVWLKSIAVAPVGTFIIGYSWFALAILFFFFLGVVLASLLRS